MIPSKVLEKVNALQASIDDLQAKQTKAFSDLQAVIANNPDNSAELQLIANALDFAKADIESTEVPVTETPVIEEPPVV